jgi:hypothetical protein
MLLEQELFLIFGQVALLFSNTLADAFSRLEPQVRHNLPPLTA